jgi:hypothetical protein
MAQLLELLKSMQEQLRTRGAKINKILADDKAWREEMEASRNALRKETMACQRKTDARLEGEVAYEEVAKEDAAMMPVGEPKKRRRDRNPDARRRGKPKERTQGKNGCRKNLVAALRRTTRRAIVAWRGRNFCGPLKQLVAPVKGRPAVQEWHGAREIMPADYAGRLTKR